MAYLFIQLLTNNYSLSTNPTDIRKIEKNNMNHFIPINLTTSRGMYKFLEKKILRKHK